MPTTEPEITLAQLARNVLQATDGDTDKAIARVSSQLRADKALLRRVVASAVASAVYSTVQHATRDKRGVIMQSNAKASASASASQLSGKARIESIAAAMAGAYLLDMTMAGGLKVRDANAAAFRENIRLNRSQINTMSVKVRYWELCLRSLPDESTIAGAVIDDARAIELMEEARAQEARAKEAVV